MDPLTPATSTLSPAISHIAETASALSASLVERAASLRSERSKKMQEKNQSARQTVRWVLDAPQRLSKFLEDGHKDQAQSEWAEVQRLLEKWQGVSGVEAVRSGCEKAMENVDS
jgi:vacuolar protein sorting-associated protein 51